MNATESRPRVEYVYNADDASSYLQVSREDFVRAAWTLRLFGRLVAGERTWLPLEVVAVGEWLDR